MMNGQNISPAGSQASAGHHYLIMSLAALVVILLVLLHWGMDRWSFVPVLIGALGVTLRWRITPLLTLLLLAGLLLVSESTDRSLLPRYTTRGFSLPDWLLCGAVLALCVAQYRIQGLASVFPTQRKRQKTQGKSSKAPAAGSSALSLFPLGSGRLVSPLEVGWLVLSLPIWAFLAQLCWQLTPAGTRLYGFTPQTWRGIVLAWLLGIGALIAAAIFSYAGQHRLGERQARLFLQDVLWQETGREQRRLSAWLAWARVRRRRKEKP
jgi:hypothetical protein